MEGKTLTSHAVRTHLRLLSRSTVAPVSGSHMRTWTVLLMRSCAVPPADVAARVAASCKVNPELSCSRKIWVRSCQQQQQGLSSLCFDAEQTWHGCADDVWVHSGHLSHVLQGESSKFAKVDC